MYSADLGRVGNIQYRMYAETDTEFEIAEAWLGREVRRVAGCRPPPGTHQVSTRSGPIWWELPPDLGEGAKAAAISLVRGYFAETVAVLVVSVRAHVVGDLRFYGEAEIRGCWEPRGDRTEVERELISAAEDEGLCDRAHQALIARLRDVIADGERAAALISQLGA